MQLRCQILTFTSNFNLRSRVMATARLRELGQLSPGHTVLMVCDLQEKFAPSIAHFWAIVKNAERLIKARQG